MRKPTATPIVTDTDRNPGRTDTNPDPGSGYAGPDRCNSRSAHLAKAREHWTTAKEMIDRMGYHRRGRGLEEIAIQVA